MHNEQTQMTRNNGSVVPHIHAATTTKAIRSILLGRNRPASRRPISRALGFMNSKGCDIVLVTTGVVLGEAVMLASVMLQLGIKFPGMA